VTGMPRTRRGAASDLDSPTVTSALEHAGPSGRRTSVGGTSAREAVLVADPLKARRPVGVAAIALGVAAVAAQMAYPLLAGPALRAGTFAAVLLFAAANVLHAAGRLGPPGAVALLAGAGGLGLAAEAIGVATGLPFGRYAYSGTLGPQVLGVPLLVPLAWTMMAYPALLAARRLARGIGHARRLATAVLGGWTLAAWDLFLDPQMVAAGHWTWLHPSPSLPGAPAVPLTNTAGWLVVGIAMTALLDRLLPGGATPPRAGGQVLPAALLLWTWLGYVVANLAFFDRPWVALLGGAAMAPVVVPSVTALTTAARRDLLRGVAR
jgi:uncharacterized membrane protein